MNWIKAYLLGMVYLSGLGGAVESALAGNWVATEIFIGVLIVFTAVYLLLKVEKAAVCGLYNGGKEGCQ